jgi:hypothetical protein
VVPQLRGYCDDETEQRAILIHEVERAVALFDESVVDGRGCRVRVARLLVRQAFPRRTYETT